MPTTEAFVYREGELVDRLVVGQLTGRGLAPYECAWVCLSGLAADDLAVLQSTFGVSPTAVVDMLDRDRWTILEQHDDHVFMSFRGACSAGEGSAAIVGANFIITVEDDARPECHRLRSRVEEDAARLAYGPDYILYVLLTNVVTRYATLLAALQERVMETGRRALVAEEIDRRYDIASRLRLRLRQVREALGSFGDLEDPFDRRIGSAGADRLRGPFAALFADARHLGRSVGPLLDILDTATAYDRHKALFEKRRRRSLVIVGLLTSLLALLTIHAGLDHSSIARLGIVVYMVNFAARAGLALCTTVLLIDLIGSRRRT